MNFKAMFYIQRNTTEFKKSISVPFFTWRELKLLDKYLFNCKMNLSENVHLINNI